MIVNFSLLGAILLRVPGAVDEVGNRVQEVVAHEAGPGVLVLALAEVFVFLLTGNNLTVIADIIASRRVLVSRPAHKSVLCVNRADFWLMENALGKIEEVLWPQVRHVETRSVVKVPRPSDLVVCVGVVEVQSVNLVVNWSHSIRVKVHKIKAWRLALVSGRRAHNEIDASWLLCHQISHHLQLVVVHVRIHAETDYVREAVDDGAEAVAELVRALLEVREVAQKDCRAIHCLDLLELINQPLQLVRRVVESRQRVPVLEVANVGVERQDARLLVHLLRKILILLEQFPVRFIANERLPGRGPRLEVLVKLRHREHILRIGIVIADGRDDLTLLLWKSIDD